MNILVVLASLVTLTAPKADSDREVDLMGCKWSIPDRFIKKEEHMWEPSSGELGMIFYDEGAFDKSYVEIAVTPSVRKQKVSFEQTDNGYEITVFSEYLQNNEEVVFPSWVVVKRLSGQGVFYLSGLGLDEVRAFIAPCMPGVK